MLGQEINPYKTRSKNRSITKIITSKNEIINLIIFLISLLSLILKTIAAKMGIIKPKKVPSPATDPIRLKGAIDAT